MNDLLPKPRERRHDADRRFLASVQAASLTEIEAWIADISDPDSNARYLDTWQRLAIYRRFKRLTGRDWDQP